jgi:hypothetical protein
MIQHSILALLLEAGCARATADARDTASAGSTPAPPGWPRLHLATSLDAAALGSAEADGMKGVWPLEEEAEPVAPWMGRNCE